MQRTWGEYYIIIFCFSVFLMKCVLMYKYMQWDDPYDMKCNKMQLMGHFLFLYIFFEMHDGIVDHVGV